MNFKWSRILIAGVLFLSACSPYRFFYYPSKNLHLDPAKLDFDYEMKWFESDNGKKLFGLFFPAQGPVEGLVVHFHGNYGNVSNHFLFSHFLTNYGYDVFIFDYQGYGGSEGTPNPKRTFEDGVAALKYAQSINRSPNANLFVLGHSLGGAIALYTLANGIDIPVVDAAIIQSSFSSYSGIARKVLGSSPLTWIFYPVYPLFLGWKYDPIRAVKKIQATPLLFVHGTKDFIIPPKMTTRLFEAARSKKDIYWVHGAGHNNIRAIGGEPYEKRLVSFLRAHHRKFKEDLPIPN